MSFCVKSKFHFVMAMSSALNLLESCIRKLFNFYRGKYAKVLFSFRINEKRVKVSRDTRFLVDIIKVTRNFW